ncbi:12653_t:CDS:10 [Entrophospora sp. SA101]|nr:12653_t:CDS:10 [Entrophospora sp. SA101]
MTTTLQGPNNFADDGGAVIERKLETQSEKLVIGDVKQLENFYEIERTVKFLLNGNYEKIALQFPDKLLADSVEIATIIRERTQKKVFILADTSYGSCCVDEVAAQHVDSDVIVHYGHSCLSPTSRLPVIYVFGKEPIDVDHCLEVFDELFGNNGDMTEERRACTNNIIQSFVDKDSAIIINESDKNNSSSFLEEKKITNFVTKGRYYSLPKDVNIEDCSIFYIGGESTTLSNIIITHNKCNLRKGRQENLQVNKSLMKRAKDADVIGIVVGTLGVASYLEIISHLKKLIINSGKKSYTFVMGKLNVAKMANFMEIDCYVLVACPENSLIDSKEFYRPIVTPFELEIALDLSKQWTGHYITDFQQLLTEKDYEKESKKIDDRDKVQQNEERSDYDDDEPHFSLVTGQLKQGRKYGKTNAPELRTTTDVTIRNKDTSMSILLNSAGEFLNSRTFKGLEQKIGETKAELAEEGRAGIAKGYTSDGNTVIVGTKSTKFIALDPATKKLIKLFDNNEGDNEDECSVCPVLPKDALYIGMNAYKIRIFENGIPKRNVTYTEYIPHSYDTSIELIHNTKPYNNDLYIASPNGDILSTNSYSTIAQKHNSFDKSFINNNGINKVKSHKKEVGNKKKKKGSKNHHNNNTNHKKVELKDDLKTNGTTTSTRNFEGKEVAVKRLLLDFYDIAHHEVSLLQESDDHPNVIRYYCKQQCDRFLYIALELCPASLHDLIERGSTFEHAHLIETLHPSKILYQIISGLHHLHSIKLVHRDIKPQNILITTSKHKKKIKRKDGIVYEQSTIRVLISDFGLCKKLEGDSSSFHNTTNNIGAADAWTSTDQLNCSFTSSGSSDSCDDCPRRITKAIDIFSAGCLFYYVLSRGDHPFGDRYSREINILKGVYDLNKLDDVGEKGIEARDLIERMIERDPQKRPNAETVMTHPYFWSSSKRLGFLQDASDRFEIEERDPPSLLLQHLEHEANKIIGLDWYKRMDKVFVENLGKYRKYDGAKVRDLLRALRNKKHHYQDLPVHVKRSLGEIPDGFLFYFTSRFPKLMLHVYYVIAESEYLRNESLFKHYFEIPEI